MKDRYYPIPAISAIFHRIIIMAEEQRRTEAQALRSDRLIHTAGKRHMGRKDTAGKVFFSDKERFAELINVHLYCGNKVVSGEHLIRRALGRQAPSIGIVSAIIRDRQRTSWGSPA